MVYEFSLTGWLVSTQVLGNKSERVTSPLVLPGLFILAALFGGLISVITLALLYWLSSRRFGVDREGKHGISQEDSSRLGGIAIFVSVLLFSVGAPWLSDSVAHLIELDTGPIRTVNGFEWFACVIGLIGLADDFNYSIKPLQRMLLLFIISISCFVWSPGWLPDLDRYVLYTEFLTIPLVTICISAFILVGFTNASNMIDGANGLVAIISIIFFLFAYLLTNESLYWALVLAISTFALFNITTGKIFIGDFGAYTIGALIVLISFQIFNTYVVSIWLFASFLSYPCIEIARVMLMRALRGVSPLHSDNSHLHNFIHEFFLTRFKSPLLANTTTGVSLASLSSAFPLVLYATEQVELSSPLWKLVFALQAGIFLLLAGIFRNYPSSNKLGQSTG